LNPDKPNLGVIAEHQGITIDNFEHRKPPTCIQLYGGRRYEPKYDKGKN
jgi:hypothetical protein